MVNIPFIDEREVFDGKYVLAAALVVLPGFGGRTKKLGSELGSKPLGAYKYLKFFPPIVAVPLQRVAKNIGHEKIK